MNKRLNSLDSFNASRRALHETDWNRPSPNGIACPDCGAELLDTAPMVTLTSNPPQKQTKCSKCSYVGYRIA